MRLAILLMALDIVSLTTTILMDSWLTLQKKVTNSMKIALAHSIWAPELTTATETQSDIYLTIT
jgi:hypothetical protein